MPVAVVALLVCAGLAAVGTPLLGVTVRSTRRLLITIGALSAGSLLLQLTLHSPIADLARVHAVVLVVWLAASGLGRLCAAVFRHPLDAAGVSVLIATIVTLGLLLLGQMAGDLPTAVTNAALTVNPVVAIAAAANIDLVRLPGLYDLSPVAHRAFAYPTATASIVVHLLVAVVTFSAAAAVSRRRVAAYAALAVILLCPGHAAARGASVTLEARAGLGGVVRPGRWVPVTVVLRNDGNDLRGTVVVEWGDARVRRTLDLPAPSARTIALYIRTGDVRDRVVVRLESDGATLTETAAPVRVASDAARVVVCGEHAVAPDGDVCTLTLPTADFPESYRGFDAADVIAVHDEATLRPATREALALWRAVHARDTAGNNAPAAVNVPPSPPPSAHATWPLALYIAILAAALLLLRRPRYPIALHAAVVVAMVAGSSLAVAAGRSRPIRVRHATVLQAFAGTDAAIVNGRASAEFPVPTSMPLVVTDADVAVWPSFDLREAQTDEGHGIVASEARLGETVSVVFEGSVHDSPLRYRVSGGLAQVSNVSMSALHDCRFPIGFARTQVETLPPGETIRQIGPAGTDDPVVVCHTATAPVSFAHADAAVTVSGDTTVVLHVTEMPR